MKSGVKRANRRSAGRPHLSQLVLFPCFLVSLFPVLVPTSHLLSQCLVLGAGPCGLRTAIELSLLGAQVVVVEKREAFSRNNVLHLWPFSISDLRGLGAKTFYGKFCTGSLDHISEWLFVRVVLTPSVFLPLSVHALRFYPHPKRSIVGNREIGDSFQLCSFCQRWTFLCRPPPQSFPVLS